MNKDAEKACPVTNSGINLSSETVLRRESNLLLQHPFRYNAKVVALSQKKEGSETGLIYPSKFVLVVDTDQRSHQNFALG